jgi:hypothetical protein
MREAALRIGRYVLPRRIVEGRIHQHAGGRFASHALTRELVIRRRNIQRNNARPIRKPIPLRIVFGERGEQWIDFDQRHGEPDDALRQRQSGGASACAELDCMPAIGRVARRGEQDRVMSDAVAFPRLAQDQPAPQNGVVGEIFSPHPA